MVSWRRRTMRSSLSSLEAVLFVSRASFQAEGLRCEQFNYDRKFTVSPPLNRNTNNELHRDDPIVFAGRHLPAKYFHRHGTYTSRYSIFFGRSRRLYSYKQLTIQENYKICCELALVEEANIYLFIYFVQVWPPVRSWPVITSMQGWHPPVQLSKLIIDWFRTIMCV